MNRLSILFLLGLAFAAGNADAFRDDFPADPEHDCVPPATTVSAEYREYCGLAAIERACARDPSRIAEELAKALQVKPLQVLKAMGRHTVVSLERGDLCARGEAERRQVVAASQQPKKVPSESAQEWLLRELGGASGVIDHAAVSSALQQRAKVLSDPRAKRAGLPVTPAGWANLTGYSQSAGRINHILFTSGTGNDILAGSDGGGIWHSADAGVSWSPVNDFLGSLSIANFAKASNDANTIYAATNTRGSHTYFPFGIVKSTNGGTSWAQLAPTNPSVNADFTFVQRVAVHPTNSLIVLAATDGPASIGDGGAYQSTDGGANWTKVGPSVAAYYVAIHPNDGNRRAIAYDDGTVRYTTNGDLVGAGALTSTVLAGGRYMKIAYAKSDLTRMYALVSDGTTSATRLFMSTTSGGTWTEVPTAELGDPITGNGTFFNSGYLRYTGGLWVDPTNANRVAVCEGWAAFTTDITASAAPPARWKKLNSGWVDFHGIVEHPGYDGSTNRKVFFMDDGGLYRVTDVDILDTNPSPFTQFTRLDAGMTVTEVYSVAGHGGNPILGAQDVAPKVYRTDVPNGDSSSKWRFIQRPPSSSWIGDGSTTAASTANPLVLYGSRQYLDMIRSTDGGVSATSIVTGSALTEGGGAGNNNAAFIAPFVLDPSNQSRMLAGGQSLWRSNNVDSGAPPMWTSIRAPYNETACGYMAPISVIAIAPSNSDVVWIAHECAGRIFKSINATLPAPTWTEVATIPAAMNFRSKTAITIDPTNPNIVWIGVGQYQTNTLFKTTDGGATAGNWTTIAGLPGAPVYSLVQHPGNGTWLYAATGVGLFASADGGATWSTSNEGPANIVVKSLAWSTTGVSSELLVGTFGRGVFKATVSSSAAATSTTALVAAPTSSATVGAAVTFTATVSGTSPTPTGSVIFSDGGTAIGTVALNGSAQALLVTSSLALGSHSITAAYQGDSSYAASSSSALSFTITAANPPRLANISTRGQVQTGFNVMIGGFVISGAIAKTVVVRAIGPSLANFGVSGALPNPTLQLVRSSDQSVIATNDDWGSAANAAQITSSGFAPSNPLESAILTTLQPGAYTAIVSGVGGVTGVGLVEVYEVDHPEIALINISTRGKVQTGFDVMIGGFVVQGSGPQTVVIRAIGPSLANFGVSGALANPTMSLVRMSDNATIATNDDWGSASNAAQITSSGFAPSNPLESAILITLQPGAYTAVVSGVGGGIGVGLVEVYTLP